MKFETIEDIEKFEKEIDESIANCDALNAKFNKENAELTEGIEKLEKLVDDLHIKFIFDKDFVEETTEDITVIKSFDGVEFEVFANYCVNLSEMTVFSDFALAVRAAMNYVYDTKYHHISISSNFGFHFGFKFRTAVNRDDCFNLLYELLVSYFYSKTQEHKQETPKKKEIELVIDDDDFYCASSYAEQIANIENDFICAALGEKSEEIKKIVEEVPAEHDYFFMCNLDCHGYEICDCCDYFGCCSCCVYGVSGCGLDGHCFDDNDRTDITNCHSIISDEDIPI